MTHLTNKLKEAAHARTDPAKILIAARQLLKKLETMDAEFKKLHLSVIDLLSSDADLLKEQDVLDEHEEVIDELSTHTNQLILNCMTSTEPEIRTVAHKRLTRLQKTIDSTGSEIAKFDKE